MAKMSILKCRFGSVPVPTGAKAREFTTGVRVQASAGTMSISGPLPRDAWERYYALLGSPLPSNPDIQLVSIRDREFKAPYEGREQILEQTHISGHVQYVWQRLISNGTKNLDITINGTGPSEEWIAYWHEVLEGIALS